MRDQLSSWVAQGIKAVKIKIGRERYRDPQRVAIARDCIGKDIELFVDANGALTLSHATRLARELEAYDVSWFEEPMVSAETAALCEFRSRVPMDVAVGEYGYVLDDFRILLENRSCDVLQADVTRCRGITGFLQVDALCAAFHTPLSGHCAPNLHAHVACACPSVRHLEYFHDHVRIESMLFEGTLSVENGGLRPDRTTSGHGLALREDVAQQYLVYPELAKLQG